MIEKDKTFHTYDTTIGIWRNNPLWPRNPSIEQLQDKAMFEKLRRFLRSKGFALAQDAMFNKQYPALRGAQYRGSKRDLHMRLTIGGRHIEILFFEDVVRDNKHGGEYTSRKLESMPYLLRLRAVLAMRQVSEFLKRNGYSDTTKTYSANALTAVMERRAELEDFQGKTFYSREENWTYNRTDADGKNLSDGDTRYFWTWNGRLARGTVYRNINNMFWVVTSHDAYTNIAGSDLFTWRPELGRKMPPEAPRNIARIETHLNRAIKEENFERCVVLRNLLKRLRKRVAVAA